MINEETLYDVKLENAFKSYGKNAIIKGLNMSVSSGSIYGLLGPSGCGKTTLLQCILGTMPLDSGSIDLRVHRLKDIGYMPQDTCLEVTLSIKEIFIFYGTLYNMSNSEIENRIDKLNNFLKLPDLKSFVNKISGGQYRRVSLAISLLHDPKFIILDEPTVGIDPVLRQEIWDEFVKMTREDKKTIIITTHYIEEANLADKIGLMRNGILVEEGSPKHILAKYSTNSLEECFLIACRNQKTNKDLNKSNQIHTNSESKKLSIFKNDFSYCRFKALLKKHYLSCVRDYVLLFTILVLPILQVVNLCIGIGGNIKDMPIAIKNDEVNFSDCQYSNVNECIFDEYSNETISCIVLNYLQSLDYKIVQVEDRKTGEISVKNQKAMAFLYFPKNFTQHFITYIDRDENYKSLTYAHLTKNNFVFTTQITRNIGQSIRYLIKKTLNDCSINPRTIMTPMEINIAYGQDVKTLTNSIVNFFLALAPFHTSSMYSLSIMMSEKMDGTLNRSMISGVKVLELLISMLCIATMLNVVQILFLNFIAFVLFSNPIQITNGLFMHILLVLLSGCIGFIIGLISAVVTPTKVGGVYIITGVTLSQLLLTGAIWPMEGQPQFLRKISDLIPLRVIGNTMNNITLKGWTWDHPSILIGTSGAFAILGLLVLALIILGKLKKDLWVISK